ncbi:MAG: universal stress protein [Pseudomonadota bacterium]
MAETLRQILVVIDPTRQEQWALDKAIMIAQGQASLEVTAYLAAFSTADADDHDALRAAEIARQGLWLNELLKARKPGNIDVTPVVEWHEDWPTAVIDAATRIDAGLVIKQGSGKPKALGSSDRQLIRGVQTAVMLVNRQPKAQLGTVLAALNLNAEDAEHQRLNEMLIETANRIRGTHAAADLHVVNAYPDSDNFVHPPDLAKKAGVARSHAHSQPGKPADVIEQVASKVGAELVIIGSVGRQGLSGWSIGNTAERILGSLDSDVLILGVDSG